MMKTYLSRLAAGPLCATVVVMAVGSFFVDDAQAGTPVVGSWTRSSLVNDIVTDNGNGTWSYDYTVKNTSEMDDGPDALVPIIVDWELPWFGDAGITNIRSPRNWDWAIETIGTPNPATGWEGIAEWQNPGDPFYFGDTSPFTTGTQVLHWYNTCGFQEQPSAIVTMATLAISECEGQFDNAIFPDNELDGFGFDAVYDKTAAPYQASWAFLPVQSGDPAFPLGGFPNSPTLNPPTGVPEPGTLALIALAALALAARRPRAVRRD